MRLRDRVSVAAGACALLVAVFVVGGAFRWTQAIVAACMAVAVLPLALSRRALPLRSPLVWLSGAATVLTLLQLIPLPNVVLDLLQPHGAALRADGAGIAGTSPWNALTLDAPGTLRALCFFVTLLAVSIVSLRFAVTERGRYYLLSVVATVCGFVSLVVWVHELLGASSLYGIYHPEQARPSVLGPLLNENHLGCLTAMGAIVSLGLTMYARQWARWRPVWLANTALCGATAVASQSRGATLALLGGLALTGGLLLAQRFGAPASRTRSRRAFATTSLPLAVIAACSIVLVIYVSGAGVTAQIERTDMAEVHSPLSKFAIWRSSFELIEESPWFGVGRGAFEPAFTRVHPPSAVHSFSHVENEYIQAAVDWGVPGAALLALAAGAVIFCGVRRWRDSPLIAGALGAVVAVAVQSNVDFGVELLGVSVPATIVAATIAYRSLHESVGAGRIAARVVPIGLALLLLASGMALLSDSTRSIVEDHDALENRTDIPIPEITAELERHPLDYYGFAVASETLFRERNADAVKYLNHALQLHPTHSGLHHLAARMLYDVGQRDQAAVEYSLALRGALGSRTLLTEVTSRFPPHDAAGAIPVDYEHLDETVKLLLELKRDRVATEWLMRVLDQRTSDLKACHWLYTLATRADDLQSAETASTRCKEVSPSYRNRIDLARMLLEHSRPEDALHALDDVENWPTRIDVKGAGWLVMCDAISAENKWEEAERCLHRLDATGYIMDSRRDEIITRLKKIDEALHPR